MMTDPFDNEDEGSPWPLVIGFIVFGGITSWVLITF